MVKINLHRKPLRSAFLSAVVLAVANNFTKQVLNALHIKPFSSVVSQSYADYFIVYISQLLHKIENNMKIYQVRSLLLLIN